MRTRFFAIVLAGAVLLASAPGYAQDIQSILSKVTAAYQSAKSYQAQVSITETRQMGGQQQKQSTTLTTKYKAPNKMVTIVQGRESMQVYSDGKTMYIYLPKQKQYMKMPAPASLSQQGGVGAAGAGDPAQIGMQLQTMFATGAKKLADRTVGGKPMFVLQSSRSGQSQDGKTSFQMTVTALIDKASYLLRQLTLSSVQSQGTQKLTQTITISFASQQINPNLPDSAFVFKPPAGAKEQQMPASPSGPPAPR